MTSGEIISYVIVPLIIFFLTAIGGGIVAIIRLSVYFTRTSEAQESTAKSNQEISDNLKQFIGETNGRLGEHSERLAVHDQRLSSVEQDIREISKK